ncbi:MAG: hypothetical protein ABIP64_08725, partial [Burkholderiales bacterium]
PLIQLEPDNETQADNCNLRHSHSGDEISRSRLFSHDACHETKDFVATLMSLSIVNRLEMI